MPKRRMPRHSVTQPLDKPYRFIPLTQGQNAIVDATDFDWLNQWNWHAHWDADTRSFYAYRKNGGGIIGMHQVILGCKKSDFSDHRNHNTLDNRRFNLRKSTCAENNLNKKKYRNNKSGYKGVTKSGAKWRARIVIRGHLRWLGYFVSAVEAADAYNDAAKREFGEFAHLNLLAESSNIPR